jgi:molecular chaperone HtpG
MVKPRKEHVVSPPLYIEIIINKEMNTFTVRDTGMGMTRSDLTDKLTNAARSKINDFMKSVDDGVTMTNQFSIGFFSTYFVANKVSVTTKHDNDEQYTWEARSNSSCTISPDNDGKSLGRGTKITLYLKDDQVI